MSAEARTLCLMGSGETSPTMVSVHAALMSRVASPPAPAVLLDSPYGFQENADEISAKALNYFAVNVGHAIQIASLRSLDETSALDLERFYKQLGSARYIFAGPGSPSYALRQWKGSRVPALLGERLAGGGCVTFSSAAATSLGRLALPVYEIYKVGESPHWVEGLDVLAPLGLDFIVIPHYDNNQGGTHDTRYCFMGERRLTALEREIPGDTAIFGIAEHAAAIIDLGARTLEVRGRGFVALRRRGQERRLEAGKTAPLDEFLAVAERTAASPSSAGPSSPEAAASSAGESPLLEEMLARSATFGAHLDAGDVAAAVDALLEMDEVMVRWAADTTESDAMERAHAVYRGLVARLGEVSRGSGPDATEAVQPFIALAIRLREAARVEGRYADADGIRKQLAELGVEVRDTPTGADWSYNSTP
ncbi:MAG: CysS/YqeB C-terminal domain-containing protein [Candidatus Dormibacteria bacterium]